MNLIHSDTAAKTTVISTDKLSTAPEGGNILVMKQPPFSDFHDLSKTAIYLDEIILNSDLDWF